MASASSTSSLTTGSQTDETLMKQHRRTITTDINYFIDHVNEYTAFRNSHNAMIQEILDEKLQATYKLMNELHESFVMLQKLQETREEKRKESIVSKFMFGELESGHGAFPVFYSYNDKKYQKDNTIDYNFETPITFWFKLATDVDQLKRHGHEPGLLDKVSENGSDCRVLIGYSFSGQNILELKNNIDASDGREICRLASTYNAIHFSGLKLEPTPIDFSFSNFLVCISGAKSGDKYVISALGRF